MLYWLKIKLSPKSEDEKFFLTDLLIKVLILNFSINIILNLKFFNIVIGINGYSCSNLLGSCIFLKPSWICW